MTRFTQKLAVFYPTIYMVNFFAEKLNNNAQLQKYQN